MAGNITLTSVAVKAGVSKGTVSKVLNDYPGLSDNTRKRVLRAYTELSGRPWRRSRRSGLRRRAATRNIAVISERESILSEFDQYPRQSGAKVFFSFKRHLTEAGYHILLGPTPENGQLPDYYVAENFGRRFDAMCLFSSISDGTVDSLVRAHVPVISFSGAQFDHPDLTVITSAGGAGSKMLIEHLAGLGHREIGFVGWRADHYGYLDRFQGYFLGLAKAGLAYRSEIVCQPDMSAPVDAEASEDTNRRRDAVARFMDGLTQADRLPTAFVCVNDYVACHVIDLLTQRGLHVPRDVSVAGRGHELIDREYQLTTIDGQAERFGTVAAESILNLIEVGSEEATRKIVPVKLVVGETTAAPRSAGQNG